jgi:hypothetical protein
VTVVGNTVTVDVTAPYRTQLLRAAGIATLTVHGTGTAQPQRGVLAPEP